MTHRITHSALRAPYKLTHHMENAVSRTHHTTLTHSPMKGLFYTLTTPRTWVSVTHTHHTDSQSPHTVTTEDVLSVTQSPQRLTCHQAMIHGDAHSVWLLDLINIVVSTILGRADLLNAVETTQKQYEPFPDGRLPELMELDLDLHYL